MTAVSLGSGSTGVSPLWYATRATGVVALLLLTATVILGIAGTARFTAPGLPRVVTAGLHRNCSLLVLALIAAHVLTTVADSYAGIGVASAVIPFDSRYRGFWLGLGTIASDLLLAVTLTSLVRGRLSYRAWRAVHWLAYLSWPVALWHGLGTGTDSRLSWLLALDALCVAAVGAAVCWRVSLTRASQGRAWVIAGVVLLPLATAVFVVLGPLQAGWARRAGTPVTLLGSATTGAAAAPQRVPARGTARFTGQVTRSAGPRAGQLTLTVVCRTSGTPRLTLTIVLRGTQDGSGIAMASGSVQLGGAGPQSAARGPVTSLHGHQLTAILRAPGRSARQVDVTLVISGASASGELVVRADGPA